MLVPSDSEKKIPMESSLIAYQYQFFGDYLENACESNTGAYEVIAVRKMMLVYANMANRFLFSL